MKKLFKIVAFFWACTFTQQAHHYTYSLKEMRLVAYTVLPEEKEPFDLNSEGVISHYINKTQAIILDNPIY